MTVARTATAEQVGKYLASLLRGRQDVSELHVLQSSGVIELWLIVSPGSIGAEFELHSMQRRLLQQFPEQSIDLRIHDVSRLGISGVSASVPHNAIQIEI